MRFEELCLPLRGEMLNYANKLTRHSGARSEDIVQDALVRAWKAWERWKPTPDVDPSVSVRAWMYRIVANTFANEYRDRKHIEQSLGRYQDYNDLEDPADPIEDPGDEVEAALGALLPAFRECVERFYFHDQSCKEIALAMNVSFGTVLSRLARARATLVPLLSEHARTAWGLNSARVDATLLEATEAPESDAAGVERVVAQL